LGIAGGVTQSFIGHVVDESGRVRSASGGLLTHFLIFLLETGEIDAAIVVGEATSAQDLLFRAQVAQSTEQIRKAAKSKYYPTELSKAIKQAVEEKQKIAIVGLPCQCRAIRKAMAKVLPFKECIRYVFGLVCSHTVSARYTEFLLAAAGVGKKDYDRVSYREKTGSQSANDYSFQAFKDERPVGRAIPQQGHEASKSWGRRLFVPHACDYCTDVFAEAADAVFMDAWLPAYVSDPRGTSIVVSRRAELTEMLEGLKEIGRISIAPIPPGKVAAAQKGVIAFKRERLPVRAAYALERGKIIPEGLKRSARSGPGEKFYPERFRQRNRLVCNVLWPIPLPRALKWRLLIALTGGAKLFDCGFAWREAKRVRWKMEIRKLNES